MSNDPGLGGVEAHIEKLPTMEAGKHHRSLVVEVGCGAGNEMQSMLTLHLQSSLEHSKSHASLA